MANEKSLKEKVDEWLEKQGYPLEMRVASLLRKAGFGVTQSYYYVDPQTENSREIDILAKWEELSGCIDISFVIECKMTKKPWVLFTAEETAGDFSRLASFGVLSGNARSGLGSKLSDKVTSLPWFKKEDRIAHGLTQAFTSGDDMAYKASINVLKATLARREELKEERWGSVPLTFSFPIIIVDGNLFECFLRGTEPYLAEVEEAFLFFAPRIAGNIGIMIHVLTTAALDRFCCDAKRLSERLMGLFKEDIERELKAISEEGSETPII